MTAPRHVIDWSTAAVDWSSDGYELVVALVPGATARLVTAIADGIDTQLGDPFHDADGTVVPIEPEDGEPASLLVTTRDLLTMDPNGLRDLMNAVADHVANEVSAEESHDTARIAQWVEQLRR